MAVLNRMPETRGTCQHCDVRYHRAAADPTPADRCHRCHQEIAAMIRRGDDPTAGASTTACDDQWREDRADAIGQNGNDGDHYPESFDIGEMSIQAYQDDHAGETPTAAEILRAGLGHMEDRAATYEQPQGERSMGKAAAMFQTLYAEQLAAGEFSEEMGWAFMVVLRLVRTSQGVFRADNYEDGAAYFGLQGEAAARDRREVPA